MGVILTLLYAVCLCVSVISNQSTSKKPRHVLDLSKLTPCCIKTWQGPRGTKVARLAIMSLRKITHLMWRDHPISQRNKAAKKEGRVLGCVCVCVFVEGGG